MIAAIIAVFLLEPLVYERMIGISMFSQYGYYASSGGVTKYSVFLIYKLPIFAIILCFWKKLKLENINYLYFISVICQVLAILLSYKTEWGFRLMYYFIPAEILLISRVPKAIRGNERIVKWGICLYYLVYFVILTFFRGVDGIYPYITIWN